MQDPELHKRPTMVTQDIPPLVQQLYGLKVKVNRELDSFDDQNFLVHMVPDSSIPDQIDALCHHGYVFKVLNSIDSRKDDVIDLQTHAIVHIVQAGIPTARPVRTRTGDYQTLMKLPQTNGQSNDLHVIRLFEYLPGQILSQVRLTSHLCQQLGSLVARQNIALMDFVPKDVRVLAKMGNKWSMTEIPRLWSILDHISVDSQRALVSEVIDVFTRRVLDCQHMFSQGLIHGDMNDANIIVSESEEPLCSNIQARHDPDTRQSNSTQETIAQSSTVPRDKSFESDSCTKIDGVKNRVMNITGVIDYGDLCSSLYLFEVSITMMYAMISENSDLTAMAAGGHVLEGYLSHLKLTNNELESLRLCLCARMVQSFTLGYYAHSGDPDNEYILGHAKRIWPLLKQIWSVSDKEFLEELKPFCCKV